ncbi:hypothetical protein PFICI_09396 [Pestalotiopsis fici W106-1]|uniref:Uncharacterized protein n=1 Tax=Pestalotiopsis fici (strain W106-1 / CGMCC3.15140) TaxID=1229662 RepID=W3X075_PESFW|nr:uncharacterized protein PFICI_09396 [Pestalotiopsis fici W106-1]ETS79543.1 hypothetical protein PFICI_09396 [Pestalotiopsis fici W106-1]
MAASCKAQRNKPVKEQSYSSSSTMYDRPESMPSLGKLLHEAEQELVTREHVYLKVPLQLYLKYMTRHSPNLLTPAASLSSSDRRNHGSTRHSTESKSTESKSTESKSTETEVDSIYVMYAEEQPAANTSNKIEPTPSVTRKSAGSGKTEPEVDSMYSQYPASFLKNGRRDVLHPRPSATTKCLKNSYNDTVSEYTDQDLDSIYSTYSQDLGSTQASETSDGLRPAPLAIRKKPGFKSLPIHIKKRIWMEAMPSKLLLAPKYWLRGFATRLKPPAIANFNAEVKEAIEEMGGFYRLARPRPKIDGRNPPGFPLLSLSAEKVIGVHTVTKHVVMESFEHLKPLQLHHRLQRLSDREIFPDLQTIRIASGVICADGDWTAEMVDSFFGPEYLVLVDLRDTDAINRIAHKLLDFVHENGGPTVKWYRKFTTLTRLFQYAAHWEDLEFVFGEAWLNATWKLPYTKIMWPKQGWREEVVPSTLLEHPQTKHRFKYAVIDDSEDFRSLDSQGQWDRTSPYAREILKNMPAVSPVFVFVRPENLESLSRSTTSKRNSDRS